MQEFSSISVSSYEAGSLADRLTEQSQDGWSVVAIVPTGSTITAYLGRDAADGATTGDAEPAVATLADSAGEPAVAAATAPVLDSSATDFSAVEPSESAVEPSESAVEPSESADDHDEAATELLDDGPESDADVAGLGAVDERADSASLIAEAASALDSAAETESADAILPESVSAESVSAEPASDPMMPSMPTVPESAGADSTAGAAADTLSGADAEITPTGAGDVAETFAQETAHHAGAGAAATGDAGAAAQAGAAPAGWYADPSGRFELRYWDGGQWTEHVSRAGQQYTDPPVA